MNAASQINLGLGRRLAMVLQTEASECGLACLAMIARFHGRRSTLADLRREFGSSLRGATLRDVIGLGSQIGLASRPVRLDLRELTQLRTPCILHWDLNHFVVLESVKSDRITIYDPAVGVRRLSFPTASRHFTGVAVELTPTADFKIADAAPRIKFGQLLGNIVGIKRALLSLFGLSLALEVFAMASPLFLSWVVDQALVSADRDLLVTLVIGFGLILVLQTAISAMRGWMTMGMNASIKVQSRSNLFGHLVSLPSSYFQSRHLGDVISRFGSQEAILQAMTGDMVAVLLDGLMAVLTLAIMFLFMPSLTIMVLFGACIYAAIRWFSYAPLRLASSEAIVWGARRDSHLLETLRGIDTIKLFNAQDERRVSWLNLLVETVNRQLTAEKLRLGFKIANRLLVGFLAILVIWLGAERVLENQLSVGMLLAFISYKDQFLDRVSELINKAVDLTMLRLHGERLADIALTTPENTGTSFATNVKRLPPSIELKHVSFRYGPNDPAILHDISLRIEAGESVAIVGPSGCGKTTLLRILAGLVRPTSGQVLIDGRPLGQGELAAFRSTIGVVMQDDQLFAGSIGDNIAFFSDRPDFDRVRSCALLAAISDEIEAMPMSYGTLIGDMGTVLSGGQKQRVLLARALYRRPSILLLDEATSHLDLARERRVNMALRSTRMTRVMIAHRPETIRAADRIIDLGKHVSLSTQRPLEDILRG